MLPGTLATTVFGDQIETALSGTGAINWWIVGGALALLAGGAFAVKRWFSSMAAHGLADAWRGPAAASLTGARSTRSSARDCLRDRLLQRARLRRLATASATPQRIAEVIEELGCDTVGLQEVDYRLDYIAQKLGMQAIAGRRTCGTTATSATRCSRAARCSPCATTTTADSRREPRTALDVDLEVDGEPVRVIVTHLGLRPAERRYQVQEAARAAARDARCYERVVVLGDINEWLPLGRPLRWMHALLRPFARRALVPVALAAVRARPRLGAAAPRAARVQGAPLAARRARLRPPAGQGDHRPARAGSEQATPQRLRRSPRLSLRPLPSAAAASPAGRTRAGELAVACCGRRGGSA